MRHYQSSEFGVRNSEYTPHSALRTPHSQCGFTLVELMVVMAVFGVLGVGFITAMVTGQTAFFTNDAGIQVQQEARRALDVMVRELREAGPPSGTSMNKATNVPVAGVDRLNFQRALGYAGGAITWGGDTVANNWLHYVVVVNFSLPANNNRQLLRCETAGQTTRDVVITSAADCLPATIRVLANDINTVTFSDPTASKVVTITLETRYNTPSAAGGFRSSGVVTSRVWVRN